MAVSFRTTSLGDLQANTSIFEGIVEWTHQNPTIVKIAKVAGVILGLALLVSLPFTAPILSLSLTAGLAIVGGVLLLASTGSFVASNTPFSSNVRYASASSSGVSSETNKQTMRVMEMVRPYFLSPYTQGTPHDKITRMINGEFYSVERANHGLAHGLRQGALAKDVFTLLLDHPISDSSGIVNWARRKMQSDPHWIQKIEMAASFQRSGRQSECSSTSHPDLYKKYEMQDAIYFRDHAQSSSLFSSDAERRIFEEAILWSNRGTLDENENEDLKYLRRILHAAHTLDLRRMLSFDPKRIQKDAMDQLFGGDLPLEVESFKQLLWDRSGKYLHATGDRDVVTGRYYQNQFFVLNRNPEKLVRTICNIS